MRIALPLGMIAIAALFAQEPGSRTVSKADVDRWMKELSNWGRWGAGDQKGSVNLITPAKRKSAAALVKEGFAVSLAHDADTEKAVDNSAPYGHRMIATGAKPAGQFVMDVYSVSYHGLAHTHMDALSHMAWDGKMYNGAAQSAVTERGAPDLAVTAYKDGIFTRGILMDIPRLKSVPYLEPGTAIYPEDLDAWEKKAGVKVGAGDVVFIRTGRWGRRKDKGAWDPSRVAGLYASGAGGVEERGGPGGGRDAGAGVYPSGGFRAGPAHRPPPPISH